MNMYRKTRPELWPEAEVEDMVTTLFREDNPLHKAVPEECRELVGELWRRWRNAEDVLAGLNQPKKVLKPKWNPSECPSCGHDFRDFEPCDDGYYDRAEGMERCYYCGQRLDWGW